MVVQRRRHGAEFKAKVADMPRDVPNDPVQAFRRLQDEMVIRDLITRYVYYHDARKIDAKVNLHHPDCVLRHNARLLTLLWRHCRRVYKEQQPLKRIVLGQAPDAAKLMLSGRPDWMTPKSY